MVVLQIRKNVNNVNNGLKSRIFITAGQSEATTCGKERTEATA